MFSSNTSQVSNDATYIEDVFSTYLYTGNGSTQTITNGIDLAGKGGLVWFGRRDTTNFNVFVDSERGTSNTLNSYSTAAQSSAATNLTFTSTGFTQNNSFGGFNASGGSYCPWTFRKQPKFFDVVTYTGNGQNNRQIAHNLGSVPGCIMVKRTNAASDWYVYHRGLNGGTNPQNYYILLNSTAAQGTYEVWENTAPTSTVFTVDEFSSVNGSGDTFVAYLFAHNAGGFGLTGTDNVISCGSYTGAGASTTINLGWEPQWVLIKNTAGPFPWWIQDNMRGMTVTGDNGVLYAQAADAEAQRGSHVIPTATGFTFTANEGDLNGSGSTYIYIAIRRGPMKTPTSGTSVFGTALWTGNGTNPRTFTDANWTFPGDYLHVKARSSATWYNIDSTRLTGTGTLSTNDTGAELNSTNSTAGYPSSWNQAGFTAAAGTSSNGNFNANTVTYVGYMWGRAPGFFDVVCYTGTGTARTVTHNLGVVPELMIVRSRSAIAQWYVYAAPLGNTKAIILNGNGTPNTGSEYWNNTTPTSSVFTVGVNSSVNGSGRTQVAYLFASCPGVSKVFNFTGNGSSQTINCGFTSGARFVMIKRTDSTGNWTVFDSARGISASGDPALYLNSTAAEVTGVDAVDADSSGFIVNQESTFNLNVNGASYIGLAIA